MERSVVNATGKTYFYIFKGNAVVVLSYPLIKEAHDRFTTVP